MVNIKGSTVVVTGGQRGLGKAIVDELLQRGAAKVYATARAPKPSEDPRVVSVELDVTKPDSVAALAVTASDADIVVNNAGVLGAREAARQRHRGSPGGVRDQLLRRASGRQGVRAGPGRQRRRSAGRHQLGVVLGGRLRWLRRLQGGAVVGDATRCASSSRSRAPLVTAVAPGLHRHRDDLRRSTCRRTTRARWHAQIVDGIERGDAEVLADDDHPLRQGGAVRTGRGAAGQLTAETDRAIDQCAGPA